MLSCRRGARCFQQWHWGTAWHPRTCQLFAAEQPGARATPKVWRPLVRSVYCNWLCARALCVIAVFSDFIASGCALLHLTSWTRVRDSGHFVKQEKWERWWVEPKMVSGSKHWGRFCGFRVYHPQKKMLRPYVRNPMILCILVGKWFAVPSIMRS